MGTSLTPDPDSKNVDNSSSTWLQRHLQLPLQVIGALRRRTDYVNACLALGFGGGVVLAQYVPTAAAPFLAIGIALLAGSIAISFTRRRTRGRR
jgi:hypothetical protein